MFDRTQHMGLMKRMVSNFGLPQNEIGWTMVYPIGVACYPKAAPRGLDPILPPRLSVQEIRRVTAQCVDGGGGTIDDLYRRIWGVDGLEGYMNALGGEGATSHGKP